MAIDYCEHKDYYQLNAQKWIKNKNPHNKNETEEHPAQRAKR